MTAPSSPGRTWSILDPERGLRALVTAIPAVVCLTGRGGAGLSGLARFTSTSASPHKADAVDSVDECRHDRAGLRDVGSTVGAVSLARLATNSAFQRWLSGDGDEVAEHAHRNVGARRRVLAAGTIASVGRPRRRGQGRGGRARHHVTNLRSSR